MIAGEGGLLLLYSTWLSCYGVAFTAVPYQVGELRCNVETEYQKAKKKVDDFVITMLPEPIRHVKERIDQVKSRVEGEIKRAVEKAGIELVKFVTDKTTGDFVDLLANPENATEGRLNEVFATVGDAGGKQLLQFDHVSSLINKDLGVDQGRLKPELFYALSYALTLAKMSILPAVELNRLVTDIGGTHATRSICRKRRTFLHSLRCREID